MCSVYLHRICSVFWLNLWRQGGGTMSTVGPLHKLDVWRDLQWLGKKQQPYGVAVWLHSLILVLCTRYIDRDVICSIRAPGRWNFTSRVLCLHVNIWYVDIADGERGTHRFMANSLRLCMQSSSCKMHKKAFVSKECEKMWPCLTLLLQCQP